MAMVETSFDLLGDNSSINCNIINALCCQNHYPIIIDMAITEMCKYPPYLMSDTIPHTYTSE